MKIIGRLLVLTTLGLCLYFTIDTYLLPTGWQLGIPKGEAKKTIYFPTGSSLTEMAKILEREMGLIDVQDFLEVANEAELEPRAGKFEMPTGLKYQEIVDFIRSGKQSPVRLVINNKRTKRDLAAYVAEYLELTEQDLIETMQNPDYLKSLGGYDTFNIVAAIIPNSYDFFWNTNAEQFLHRMVKESQKFWTEKRLKKARELGLNTKEVITLASIVEKETNYNPEKDRIAGVYLNRLKSKGWKLQADPTVIFAWQDYSIRRVLLKHTRLDSPYNTYRYAGLPPGPICLPSIASIDATLNAEDHKYMFFCAKSDFSGSHRFAKNYSEHLKNAKAYHKALRKRDL